MRHDRHLEEPPEHPDDCACRECRIFDADGNVTNAWAAELAALRPINDTHRCSGGPEEITDEEWEKYNASQKK